MENGQPVDGSYFFYAPNKAAPVFFAVAFAASCICHLWQCIHYNCFRLTILYPLCCLIFTAGFATREAGAFYDDNLKLYIAGVCLIYSAPPLLELANYHVLGRILYYVPYNSPIHPGRVLSTFIFLSGIVESLNGWGASYSANASLPQSTINIGHALLKTALLLQLMVATSFIFLAVTFHRRCLRTGILNHKVQAPLVTLYISTALITTRTIYRVYEYFSLADLKFTPGFDWHTLSPVVRYEWFFYVFEASLMLANCVLFNFCHPRRYLPENNKIYLAQDGRTEVEGPGWEDQRPWIVTVADPFDIAGSLSGKSAMQHKFWENNGFTFANAESAEDESKRGEQSV